MNKNKKSDYVSWTTMVDALSSIMKEHKTTSVEKASLERAISALFFIRITGQERIFHQYVRDSSKPFTETQIKFLGTTAGRMEMFRLDVGRMEPLTFEKENELFALAQQGDREAEYLLYDAYDPLILEVIDEKFKLFFLVQMGRAGVSFATQKYKPQQNLPLKDFVRHEIEQQIEKAWEEYVAKRKNWKRK